MISADRLTLRDWARYGSRMTTPATSQSGPTINLDPIRRLFDQRHPTSPKPGTRFRTIDQIEAFRSGKRI